MRDSLDGIGVFVEAAEAGGFSRAAERLALSRSAVGKTIARLESRLGVRLFHRTTRSQSLTEDGQIYYERCLRALEELKIGAALLESGRREVAGKLKIAMPLLFGRYCVTPILLELAARHPKLELDIHLSDQVVDLIGDGFDLAIRHHSPGSSGGVQAKKIVSLRKVVCASPSYLAARGKPTDLATLMEHEALVYWHRDHIFPWTFRGDDGRLVEPELRWRLQFDSYEAVTDAAVKGMGVACLPSWLVRDHLETNRLVSLLEDAPTIPFDTFVVWPAVKNLPMKLRAAVDALVDGLQWAGDL